MLMKKRTMFGEALYFFRNAELVVIIFAVFILGQSCILCKVICGNEVADLQCRFYDVIRKQFDFLIGDSKF